ncbi:hypothetical protein [Azospirillum palustre]
MAINYKRYRHRGFMMRLAMTRSATHEAPNDNVVWQSWE